MMRHLLKSLLFLAVIMLASSVTAKYTNFTMYQTLLFVLTGIVAGHVTDKDSHERVELVTYEIEFTPDEEEQKGRD